MFTLKNNFFFLLEKMLIFTWKLSSVFEKDPKFVVYRWYAQNCVYASIYNEIFNEKHENRKKKN